NIFIVTPSSVVRASAGCRLLNPSSGRSSRWKRNNNPTHDIVEFQAALVALGMAIVTVDAGLGNRAIRINGLEHRPASVGHDAGIRLLRRLEHLLQAGAFKGICGAIRLIDRR